MKPRYYKPLRPFHDPDLCGGTMGFTEDPLRDVYTLYCSCGFMGEVTLEEILRAEPFTPCAACGERTLSRTCASCATVAREFGAIVAVHRNSKVLK